MKKINRITAIAAAIGMTVCGCSVEKPAAEEENKPITLTICIAEAQWDPTIDGLTALYLEKHPEIEDIQWLLIRKKAYWDLMNMKLATGTLPDIMEVGVGEELEKWNDQLIPLDDLPVLNQVFADVLDAGKFNGHYYSVPQSIYGIGILYNMELLQRAGWDRVPRTKTQLKRL